MKKQRNHSWLKDQEQEAGLLSLIVTEFKTEIMKMLKELRKVINRSADDCKKDIESIRRSPEKLENSFEETKTELKTMNNITNNAEGWISDLE